VTVRRNKEQIHKFIGAVQKNATASNSKITTLAYDDRDLGKTSSNKKLSRKRIVKRGLTSASKDGRGHLTGKSSQATLPATESPSF